MDDNSILEFGKYRGKKISTLSTVYLNGLYGSFKTNGEQPELVKYLEKYFNILQVPSKIEKPSIITIKQVRNKTEMFCNIENKIMYVTEKDAKSELRRIANTDSPKKPIKTYECNSCGGFHLTSRLSNHQLKFITV
jgi:hypothetical protein